MEKISEAMPLVLFLLVGLNVFLAGVLVIALVLRHKYRKHPDGKEES